MVSPLTYAGVAVSVVVDGDRLDDWTVAERAESFAQNQADLGSPLFSGSGAPVLDQLTGYRAGVAQLVVDRLLVCEGERAGLSVTRDQALAAAQSQWNGYQANLANGGLHDSTPLTRADFLSDQALAARQRQMVEQGERTQVVNGTTGAASARAIASWLSSELKTHTVVVTGLGTFSLGDAYLSGHPQG
ncbi:MAG: hypothetical protein ACYDAY_07125 [Candidatus Dormibacteria bacterium]